MIRSFIIHESLVPKTEQDSSNYLRCCSWKISFALSLSFNFYIFLLLCWLWNRPIGGFKTFRKQSNLHPPVYTLTYFQKLSKQIKKVILILSHDEKSLDYTTEITFVGKSPMQPSQVVMKPSRAVLQLPSPEVELAGTHTSQDFHL